MKSGSQRVYFSLSDQLFRKMDKAGYFYLRGLGLRATGELGTWETAKAGRI
jgi:hypothetical protein